MNAPNKILYVVVFPVVNINRNAVAGIILWCMVAHTVHDTELPATLLFSCTLVCTNAAQMAGALVGMLNAHTLGQGDIALTAVALDIYLLAMVSLFLFKDKTLCGFGAVAEEGAHRRAAGRRAGARCAHVAEAHGLTPRESGDPRASGARAHRARDFRAGSIGEHGEVPHQVHLPEA